MAWCPLPASGGDFRILAFYKDAARGKVEGEKVKIKDKKREEVGVF